EARGRADEPAVAGRHLGGQPVADLDRGRPADLGNAERGDDPLDRATASLLDRRMEILGALACEPVQALEVLHGEPEEVTAALHEPGLEQLLQRLPAGALDVHAADEVAELLADPGGARRVWAIVADGALVPNDGRAAHRARGGHVPLRWRPRSLLGEGPDH